jgi:hypothetical protein
MEALDLLVGEDAQVLLLRLWQLETLGRIVVEELLNVKPMQEGLDLPTVALDSLRAAWSIVWPQYVAQPYQPGASSKYMGCWGEQSTTLSGAAFLLIRVSRRAGVNHMAPDELLSGVKPYISVIL